LAAYVRLFRRSISQTISYFRNRLFLLERFAWAICMWRGIKTLSERENREHQACVHGNENADAY